MLFSVADVKKIELGLINACVLSCPMCLRLEGHVSNLKPGVALDYEKLVNILEQFKNLETLDLIGSISEPLMYPKFLDLIRYAKNRKIKLRIGTNANVQNRSFWEEFGRLLDKNDIVRFAVDGSTQEIHQVYRVGGSLKKVLVNHHIFKQNSSAITILQHLVFQHNRDDFKNIENVFLENKFDVIEKIESGEPAYLTSTSTTQAMPRDELVEYYRDLERKIKNIKLEKFECFARSNDQMYINHLGHLLPCDDMEELAFGLSKEGNNSIPTIYNNSLESCVDFANDLVKKRFFSEICKRCCSQEVMKTKKKYPVLQSTDTLNYEALTVFRGVVSVK